MQNLQKEISDFKLMIVGAMPFYGEILLRVPILPDKHVATACTDGSVIRYSPRFFHSLSRGERHFVLLHEVLHIIYLHAYRRGDRNPALWNTAGDIVINRLLVNKTQTIRALGIPFEKPRQGIFESVSYQQSTEDVYARLCELNAENATDIRWVKLPKAYNAKSHPMVKPPSDVLYPATDAASDLNDNGLSDGLSQAALVALLQETEKKGFSDALGINLTRELGDILKNNGRKRKDWRKELRSFLSENISDETSYTTPERKYIHMDLMIPGYSLSVERLEELWAFVDCSGSISNDEMREFLFQLYRIAVEFRCVMNICYWDTAVEDVYRRIRNKQQILESLPTHSGGTDVNCVYRWLRENKLSPDVMMILTDGEFGALNSDFIPSLKRRTILVLSNEYIRHDDFKRIGTITRL